MANKPIYKPHALGPPAWRKLTRQRANGGMAPIRERFVMEYLIDLHPTQAAIRAGYSPARASSVGRTLLQVPEVRDAVARAIAARSTRTGVNNDRIMRVLGAIVMGDPRAVFDEQGGLKKPGELNDMDALMIAGVKTRRIVEVNPETGGMQQVEIQEIKLVDKLSAMNMAMRHLGMLNDKLQVEVGGPLAEQLAAAIARQEGAPQDEPVIAGTDGLTDDDYRELLSEEGEIVDVEVVEEPELTPVQRALLYGEDGE